MSEPREFSKGGSEIHRYGEPEKSFEPAIGSPAGIKLIEEHIARYIGKPKSVFHEILSDIVHIDVHFIAPSEGRPFNTLITSGMSDLPMKAPEGFEQCMYAELMICLPADWPMGQEDFKREANYWPVRSLKFLARFPHKFKTWLFLTHTMPNGDPSEPIANTGFHGFMLARPKTVPKEFGELKASTGKMIHFLAVYPLYREEMEFKLKQGADALLEKFDRAEVSELVNVRRKNVAKKFLGIF